MSTPCIWCVVTSGRGQLSLRELQHATRVPRHAGLWTQTKGFPFLRQRGPASISPCFPAIRTPGLHRLLRRGPPGQHPPPPRRGGSELLRHTATARPTDLPTRNRSSRTAARELPRRSHQGQPFRMKPWTLQTGKAPEHFWLWARLGSHQTNRLWDQIMTAAYGEWSMAVVLKLCAEASCPKFTGGPAGYCKFDTGTSAGCHTNNYSQVVWTT